MGTSSIHKIRSICPLFACPSSDGIVATVENGVVTKIEGDKEHPWSKGYICPKGHDEWKVLCHPPNVSSSPF